MLKTLAKRTGFRSDLPRSKKVLEYASKKSKWSWNSGNSKHGDEIGVGGQKLKLSSRWVSTTFRMASMFIPSGLFCVFFYYLLFFSFIHVFFLCYGCGGDEMARL